MSRIVASAVLASLVGFAIPAAAGEPEVGTSGAISSLAVSELPPLATDTDWSLPPVHVGRPTRGAVLPALYVSLAGLNAFDAYSTSKGPSNGAVEANPVMRSTARHPAVMWAAKSGVTAVSIALAERLWRQDRRAAAITTLIVSNALAGFAAVNNASVLRK